MLSPDFLRQPVRALVFDLDGTLYQSEEMGNQVTSCACRYVAFLKGVSEEMAAQLIEQARTRDGNVAGTLSQSVQMLGGDLKALHQRFAEEVLPEGVLSADPRVTGLLRELRDAFQLYLYTNNNEKLSARIMEQIGVTGLFRRVFTIEDSWRPKPDREVLLGILESIGSPPEEILFIGDRYSVDLALPASLGCPVFEIKTVDELLVLTELLPR